VFRIAYVNGRYRPYRDALVHIEDRGYQFADGVYEVCEVRGGRIVDERHHMERLAISLAEVRISRPMPFTALSVILREIVARNRVRDGIVYLQVTRGVARRDHGFPPSDTAPAVVAMARSRDLAGAEWTAARGIAVITVQENRWARPDIKSISLLPNILAKQEARERDAAEAWFVDAAGFVTEGASSNAWIVTGADVVTRPTDGRILNGISRHVVLRVIAEQGLRLAERPFSVAEAMTAAEAFVTAASLIVQPVVRIDGVQVGNGQPGPVSLALRRSFHRHAEFT
jgi:D-alanine transaminase